jgi:hypothetical protein
VITARAQQQSSDKVAAVLLAKALSEALYPDAHGERAMTGRAILLPVCLDTVMLLADAGFAIVADDNPYGLYEPRTGSE